MKARNRRTAKPKQRKMPTAVRRHASSAAILQKQLDQRTRELAEARKHLTEALERQTATADVLKVISRSTFDLQAVLDTLAESATRLCDADTTWLYRRDGDVYRWAASSGYSSEEYERTKRIMRTRSLSAGRDSVVGRVALEGRAVQIADLLADPEYKQTELAKLARARTSLGIPLLREGAPIGVIALQRTEVRPFNDQQIELATTFADQAVIAIENVRLFEAEQQRSRELTESLQQQTATADVLSVISSSPGDLVPVFQAMLSNAVRICEASYGVLFRFESGAWSAAAMHGVPPGFSEFWQRGAQRPGPRTALGRVAETKQTVHIADVTTEPAYVEGEPIFVAAVNLGRFRTMLTVPMVKDNELIGVFAIYRQEVRPFAEKQIELVRNFAAQAVIAIENARLLNELRESLQQQTATADVLKVISRATFDLPTVLKTLLESAARLCEADQGQVFRPAGEAASYYAAADYNSNPEYNDLVRNQRFVPGREGIVGRVLLEGKSVQIADVFADSEYAYHEMAMVAGYRTALGVPLLREGVPIGIIFLTRASARPFTKKQIELAETFADQAVIAIENVRLFDEVQARTGQLAEALRYQTATSEVLNVISRSPTDTRPVFEIIGERASELCDAQFSVVTRYDGNLLHLACIQGSNSDAMELIRGIYPVSIDGGTLSARAVRERRVIHCSDVLSDPSYTARGGWRGALAVPMVQDENIIGAIFVGRSEPGLFSEGQVALLRTFADQAVIAVENARLFEEVQARNRDLTALGEVGRAVNSTIDLETVLTTIVAKATQLSNTEAGAIYVFDDASREFRLRATYGMDDTIIAEIRDRHIRVGETAVGRAVEQRMPIQVSDIQTEPSAVLDVIVRAGFRALLTVPLLGADQVVGALVVRRKEPGEFAKNTVELLQTFAAQSALAIQNARLFDNVETRTRELARSLNDLRTAQDRLVQTQKLASLGQLTAGIAHEIKNPLNFVNNFSGVSVELIDELEETLGRVSADDKTRAEITELADTLRDNLDKIVQHGKRADSIVKNMLLHSREGSGERRLIDINALVEESLNLAYHGARAEKQGFNVTLQRSFDPSAGEVDAFPQEISRVLLNLISNGFYAATKRQGRESGNGFEPTITATTKSHGDCVEIRIRDNGIGIQPEVREKMFNPFFTTKPAGEGTGLGLSLSHDIIVKQHSGIIEVDTEPGAFTEFRIILPRTAT